MDLQSIFLLLGDLVLAQGEGTVLDNQGEILELKENQALFSLRSLRNFLPDEVTDSKLSLILDELAKREFLNFHANKQEILLEIDLLKRQSVCLQWLKSLFLELDADFKDFMEGEPGVFYYLFQKELIPRSKDFILRVNPGPPCIQIHLLSKYSFREKEIPLPSFLSLFFDPMDGPHSQDCLLSWLGFLIEDHILYEENEPEQEHAKELQIIEFLRSKLLDETEVLGKLKDHVDEALEDPDPEFSPGESKLSFSLDSHGGNAIELMLIYQEQEGRTSFKKEVRNLDLPTNLSGLLKTDENGVAFLDSLTELIRLQFKDLNLRLRLESSM